MEDSVTSLDERERKAREQSGDNPPESNGNGNGHGDADAIDREAIVVNVGGQLSLTVGGEKPTDSKFRITGGAIELDGQLAKGERVRLELDCRVAGVHVDDRIDPQTREVIATTRKHVLKIEGVQLVNGDE